MAVRFPSKVDLWLAALVAPALVVPFFVAIVAGPSEPWLLLLMLVPVLTASVTWPCNYTVTDSELIVRSGIWKMRFRLAEITEVRRVPGNLLSSPAWSLDRIRISAGPRQVQVSPAAKERFLALLQERAPQARFC